MSNLPAAICSVSLGGGAGEGAGREHPWKGWPGPKTANQNGVPKHLGTSERTEQTREPRRRPVQVGRVVVVLGRGAVAGEEVAEVELGGEAVGSVVAEVGAGTKGEVGAQRAEGVRGLMWAL